MIAPLLYFVFMRQCLLYGGYLGDVSDLVPILKSIFYAATDADTHDTAIEPGV